MELNEVFIKALSTLESSLEDKIIITSDFDNKTITIGDIVYQCIYEKWVHQISVGKLKDTIGPDQILMADYINSSLGKRLKSASIQYIDAVGNAYISNPFIYIQGLKPMTKTNQHKKGSEFNLSGIKVLFLFLWDVKWVNRSYRDISKASGVSLGSIGTIILNLKESGYLKELNGKRYLLNKKSLLNRWVYGYSEKLKPKLFIGSFSGPVERIKSTSLTQYDCLMGAELVALNEKLFDSQKISIYSNGLPIDLIKEFRLNKASGGEIEIFQVPWYMDSIKDSGLDQVPKILVYADLMSSNEPRSIEVAEVIYERYLAGCIEND